MSFMKSKLDLLVRVRYSNTFPPPPCPPKLIDIPTNPLRYAKPEFLTALANDTPLPMIIDGEIGMPLDLSQFASLWDPSADGTALNPTIDYYPPLDPEDEELLADPSASTGTYTNGHVSSTTPLPAHVPWLRKTEYIARERSKPHAVIEDPQNASDRINISHEAQLRDIEASFLVNAEETFDLSNIRHPTKSDLVAVDSFEFLPDADIWSNKYDLFKFSERPGERPVDQDDSRLDTAIFRPMEKDGDHFLAYFLTADDFASAAFKAARAKVSGTGGTDPDVLSTQFHFVRDYETSKVEQDINNEFLLVLDDASAEVQSTEGSGRSKGAYYKTIERKMILKKRRMNMNDPHQKLDIINLTLEPFSAEDLEERKNDAAEVCDPDYISFAEDAEGDIEVDTDLLEDKSDVALVNMGVAEPASAEIAQTTPADVQPEMASDEAEDNVDIDG